MNDLKIISIIHIRVLNNSLELELSEDINIKNKCFLNYDNYIIPVNLFKLFSSAEFNDRYYTNAPLGNFYCKDSTNFAVWSPIASDVKLFLYTSGSNEETPKIFNMKEKNGLWTTSVNGDLDGYYYTYSVKIYSDTNEAVDPYAKAVGINGLRGAIIDLTKSNPKNFYLDISPRLKHFTDAIIYETSIRDISIADSSNITQKGKYPGLAEADTKSESSLSTGLSHIKELGITHVQLMPVFDFSYESVDEANPVKYNWGYDPQNYNVPEGSYASDPYNPYNRILELKSLIQQLHEHGLCVNMDVVYNHVFHKENNSFHKIFPGYYFRRNDDGSLSNGSGCGNDTASENPMMRRFIIDSIMYWAEEYHMDGFRVDLMGLHDIKTMNLVRESLDRFERSIMLYGEGWDLCTALPKHIKATQYNSPLMPHIGHFNDTVRDCVKGSVFFSGDKGFVNGKEGLEDQIRKCISGCIDYNSKYLGSFKSPDQCVNYVSCHDNNTLWDKLQHTNPEEDIETLKSMQKLSNAIILTSQGIAFLHSGEEFCRTKNGIENSFRSPDSINKIDWKRKFAFKDVFEYYKGLIQIRKEHPAFRMTSSEDIRKNLEFLYNTPKKSVAFILKNNANKDLWKNIYVIYNANRETIYVDLPEGSWNLIADKYTAGVSTLETLQGTLSVEGISISILFQP